jgi:Spy/CpxP family protein refolding chaperone
MKLSTRIITAILLVAGSSGVVYAFGRHGDWNLTTDEKIELVSNRVSDKLQLDDAQRQKFTGLAETVAAVMQQVRPSREQRFEEISALLREPVFDQARALQLVQQRTRLIDEKAPEVIASLAAFLDSLTPAQRMQLQEFVRDRHDHHRHDRHRHDDNPDGN